MRFAAMRVNLSLFDSAVMGRINSTVLWTPASSIFAKGFVLDDMIRESYGPQQKTIRLRRALEPAQRGMMGGVDVKEGVQAGSAGEAIGAIRNCWTEAWKNRRGADGDEGRAAPSNARAGAGVHHRRSNEAPQALDCRRG